MEGCLKDGFDRSRKKKLHVNLGNIVDESTMLYFTLDNSDAFAKDYRRSRNWMIMTIIQREFIVHELVESLS